MRPVNRELTDKRREQRIQVGAYLRALREKSGLTQRELAQRIGLTYYTFLSQIEKGSGTVQPSLYHRYAEALGVDLREFTKQMVRSHDPVAYEILFGNGEERD